MTNERSYANRNSTRVVTVVEQNRVHMDDADTVAIVTALGDLGVNAKATDQTTILKTQWWVLTLHWIGDDLPHLGFDSLLTLLGQRVWRHYRELGREGPSRIDVVGEDDEIIDSHKIEDDEPGDSGDQT